MNTAILSSLAISLVLTLVFEAGFFFLAGKRNKKDLVLLVLVNTLTNPLVVLCYWLTILYTQFNAALVLLFLEVFAVVTEGALYKKYGLEFKRPFLFSLAANSFSFAVGMLLQMIVSGF